MLTPAALLTRQRRRPFCYESEKTGPNGGTGRICCPTDICPSPLELQGNLDFRVLKAGTANEETTKNLLMLAV